MARATNEPTNYFGLSKQSARDVDGTIGGFYYFKYLDGSGIDVDGNMQSIREGGDGQEVGFRWNSRVTGDGQVIANSRPGAVGRTFVWTLGQEIGGASLVASAAGQAPIFARVAAPAATLPYITVDQRFGDEIEHAINCKLVDLTVEGEAGAPVKITAQLLSGGSVFQRDIASAFTPVVETLHPHLYPGASVSIDGAGNTTVTKFKIEANRGVDGDIQTVAITRDDLVEQSADYNLDFTAKYIDRTIYQKAQYAQGSTVQIDLATGSFDLFIQNGSYPLRVSMPNIQYIDAKVNKLDPDGKTVYLDISAMSVKSATFPLWAAINSTDATSYLLP